MTVVMCCTLANNHTIQDTSEFPCTDLGFQRNVSGRFKPVEQLGSPVPHWHQRLCLPVLVEQDSDHAIFSESASPQSASSLAPLLPPPSPDSSQTSPTIEMRYRYACRLSVHMQYHHLHGLGRLERLCMWIPCEVHDREACWGESRCCVCSTW
mmetsp:Transcript_12218/g.26215  ORF Transcript_12218/g.26215 Transcript_12218/m.26215 type:complete len:153 (-) Transcript_12218:264-722(-)